MDDDRRPSGGVENVNEPIDLAIAADRLIVLVAEEVCRSVTVRPYRVDERDEGSPTPRPLMNLRGSSKSRHAFEKTTGQRFLLYRTPSNWRWRRVFSEVSGKRLRLGGDLISPAVTRPPIRGGSRPASCPSGRGAPSSE